METNLKALQKDTPFGLVNEIFTKGEFVCPVEDEIAENENLAGELTDYEKAIYLARDKRMDECNALTKEVIANEDFDDVEKTHRVAILKKSADCLNDAFWASVYQRLADKLRERSSVGVRKDWKVVSFEAPASRPSGCMIGIISAME